MSATVAVLSVLLFASMLVIWRYSVLIEGERKEWFRQLSKMADRIQHPERVQVTPDSEYEPPEPPRDGAEMAHVGLVVPEFVSVGTTLPEES